jgi:diphthine methyl ester synthase
MVLFLVGLGLGDEKDITVRGLETVRKCSKIFLEHYTSVLGVDKEKLEAFYGKAIILADRFMVESSAETIYESAVHEDVALLVVGDPLCATTHTDMMIRAREVGAMVEVIHNASVMAAVASCGLQLYQFGQTVSVPFFDGEWRPDSWYDKCEYNAGGGRNVGKMHTLVLLDIKVKEPDFDAMIKNQTKFLPPRFMTVNQVLLLLSSLAFVQS